MADYQFDPANYPSVRAAINVDLSDVAIPDETLALPIYTGETERFIMRYLVESQYTGAYKDRADYAATLFCASLVAPALRFVSEEKLPAGFMVYQDTDLEAIASRLNSLALSRISDIIQATGDQSVDASDPNFFKVARRTRRRCIP